jgi:alpha-tubulin suppressor-like RCC1 family protein
MSENKNVIYGWGQAGLGNLCCDNVNNFPIDHNNDYYQPIPQKIEKLTNLDIIKISCGGVHNAAITKNYQVYTWGGSLYGRLGIETETSYSSTPLFINFYNKKIIDISCGRAHTLAITSEGELYGWGSARYGRLGIENFTKLEKCGDETYQTTPIKIETVSRKKIVGIACGLARSLAFTDEGELYSWGCASHGRLGLNIDIKALPFDEQPYQPIPTLVDTLKGKKIVSVAIGSVHSLAITNEGELYCWGSGTYGRLGLEEDKYQMPKDEYGDSYQPIPILVELLKNKKIVGIACGRIHSLAFTNNGELYSWGGASYGILGIGNTDHLKRDPHEDIPYQPVPILVKSLKGKKVIAVACGRTNTSFAVTDQNEVYSWGKNRGGRLGQDISDLSIDTPRLVKAIQNIGKIKQLDCGENHAMIVVTPL